MLGDLRGGSSGGMNQNRLRHDFGVLRRLLLWSDGHVQVVFVDGNALVAVQAALALVFLTDGHLNVALGRLGLVDG